MSIDLQSPVPSSARRRAARTLCSWLTPIAACAALAAACGGDEATGDPDFGAGALGPFGGVGGGSSAPVAPGVNSNGNNGVNNAVGNNNTPSTSNTPGSNNNEPIQGNGTPTANNNNNNNAGNNNTSAPGAAGAGNAPVNNMGAGGAPANPPPAGAAGSGAQQPPPQGAAGSAQTPPPVQPPPVQPPPVQPPPVTPPPAAPDIPCPAGATFCSGFESDVLPAGVNFQSNPPAQLQFDTAVRRSGTRSVFFPATAGGFNVRELVVPIPGQSFWVRLFIQTDTLFGDNNHDSLFIGSTATATEDNNQDDGPEFSEQGNQVLLNMTDNLFAAGGPGFPQMPGPQLAANTWHCVEAFFDGPSGGVQIFSDGESLIDAPGFARVTYETFRFGYIQFNTGRDVWFDDVVVAPQRVNCQ